MTNRYEVLTVDTASDNEEGGGSVTYFGETDDEPAYYTEEPAQEVPLLHLSVNHCRAPFTRQGVTRVCGYDRAKCTRKEHKKASMRRAEPGFYTALTPVTINSPVDGAFGTFQSEVDLETELRDTEARLHYEMEGIASSPGYQEAASAVLSQQTHLADTIPPEDPAFQHIRAYTDRMEVNLDRAAAEALASPPPPTKTLFNMATDRFRQSIRSKSRVGPGGVVSEATPDSKPSALEAAQKMAGNKVWLQKQFEGYNASEAAKQEEDDRLLQEEEDLLQYQVDAGYQTQHGDYQQDGAPPTLHDNPTVAIREAQWMSLKASLDKQARDDDREVKKKAAQVDPRYNILPNQLAQAEKQVADVKRAGLVSHAHVPAHQYLASQRTGTLKAPPHEVAARQHLASLRAQVKAAEATIGQIPSQAPHTSGATMTKPHPLVQEEAVAALTAQVAQQKMRLGLRGPAVDSGLVNPADPRIVLLQDQYAALTLELSGSGRQATRPPPASATDLYVEQMHRMVAEMEAKVQAQAATQHHAAGEYLSGHTARLVADLDDRFRSLSAQLESSNTSGHTVSFRDAAQLPTGSTGTATGQVTLEQVIRATKDVSVGEEVFGFSIRMPKKVLEILCPKGMTDAMRTQVAEAGLDVASLPGKYRSSSVIEMEDIHQEMANSLGQAMEIVRDQQDSQRARDRMYSTDRRNALSYIKNQEQLLTFQEELEESSEEAIYSSENQMKSVLMDLAVTEEVCDYFITSSHFPNIIRKTLEYYKALVDHIVILSNKYGFVHANVDLDHYARKLAIRRKGSQSRLEVLLKVYCDLRDGHRNKFIDSKLQQKKNGFLYLQATSTAPTPKAAGNPPQKEGVTPFPVATVKTCRRCNTKSHPTVPMCPLYHREVAAADARNLAIECQKAGGDFVAAAKVALAKHLATKGADGSPAGAPDDQK